MTQHTQALAWAREHVGEGEERSKRGDRKAESRAYYERNREAIKARVRAYQLANRDRIAARQRIRYAEKREEIAARRRAEYAANAAKFREATQRWREKNRGRHAAYTRQWRTDNLERARAAETARKKAHPERAREINARRRARKRKAQTEPVSFAAILERDGYVCHICEGKVAPGDLHFDHVIPLALGGPHSEQNIRVSHSLCNLRKGAKVA